MKAVTVLCAMHLNLIGHARQLHDALVPMHCENTAKSHLFAFLQCVVANAYAVSQQWQFVHDAAENDKGTEEGCCKALC